MTEQEIELMDALRGMFTLTEGEIVKLDHAFKQVRKLAREEFLSDAPNPKADVVWKRWYAAKRRPMDIIKCGKALEFYGSKQQVSAIVPQPGKDDKRTLWDVLYDKEDDSCATSVARIAQFDDTDYWRRTISTTHTSFTFNRWSDYGKMYVVGDLYALELSATIKAHIESVCERVGCFYNEDSK